MKKIYGFLGALALVAMASCSSEEPVVNTDNGSKQEGDFYMTMTITQAKGSRTSTPNQGSEVGQDYENAITNGLFILAETNDEGTIIATAEIAYENITGTSPAYAASFKMVRERLAAKFEEQDTEKEFAIYVIANAPTALCDKISAKGPDEDGENAQTVQDVFTLIGETNLDLYWQKNKFLMTNATAAKTNKIKKEDVQPGAHSTRQTALNLGSVEVQRAMSRIDISKKKLEFQVENQKSPLKGVTFTIDAISLINQATTANLFKEVGTTPSDKKMFTAETYTNYVFSPEQTQFLDPMYDGTVSDGKIGGRQKKFTDLNWTLLSDLKTEDNAEYTYEPSEGSNPPRDTPNDDYYIWTYCMPNTNYDKDNQLHGNTTGVVFRVSLTFNATENPALANAEAAKTAKKAIYAYGNTLIGTFEDLEAYAESYKDDPDRITTVFNEAKKDWESSSDQKVKDSKLVERGFNIYRPNEEGVYYCYYIYWNRHNDNYNNSLMWYTEFATVRNNVYKLALTAINDLGHPADPDDDNDEDDPGTEDEQDLFWGQVEVNVLPWAVRINNFEF